MKTYKYVNAANQVVHIIDEDGKSRASCLASDLEEGTEILPADSPTAEQQIAEINAECRRRILAKYDAEKQLSFGQGLYPLAMRESCAQFINDCVAESNRLSDCITAGTPVIPNWPV